MTLLPKFALEARKLRLAACLGDDSDAWVIGLRDFISAAPTNQELFEQALGIAMRTLDKLSDHCEHEGFDELCECSTRMSIDAATAITQIHALGGEG